MGKFKWLTGLCLIVLLIFTSFNVLGSNKIVTGQLVFPGIKIFVDCVEVPGEEEPFVYNDRTYVPLRLIAKAFGKEIEWDEKSNTVYIGRQPNSGAIKLQDLIPLKVTGSWDSNNTVRVANKILIQGTYVDNVMYSSAFAGGNQIVSRAEYKLNKEYSKIEGCFVIADETANTRLDGEIGFLCDGEWYYRKRITNRDEPVHFSVNLENVENFSIFINKYDNSSTTDDKIVLALYDVKLFKKGSET